MKRVLTTVLTIALTGLLINSCKKDDSSVSTNSISIQGEFSVGIQTYTNPAFDLGEADNQLGYLALFSKKGTDYNTIVINNDNEIVLADGNRINYELHLYSAVAATNVDMFARIGIYPEGSAKEGYIILYGVNAKATITKVDEIGGYIEGTYEGDFTYPTKNPLPLHIIGKFKVLRTEEPVK